MTTTKRKIYFVSGTFIGLILIVVFIILPSIQEMKEISNDIHAQKEKLEKLYLEGRFLKPTKNQYEKMEPQITDLSKVFVINDQELEIITTLEKIALKNKLEQKIDLQEPLENEEEQQNSKYEVMPLSIKIIGNYSNFLKYLTKVETLDYQINIKDYRIFSTEVGEIIMDEIKFIDKNIVSVLINAEVFRTR